MYHRKYYPLLAVFGLVLLLCSQAFGQIVVELKETRRDFMVGEPVTLKLTLHNNSDETMALRDIGEMPWLFLRVTQRGAGNRTISPIARAKKLFSPANPDAIHANVQPHSGSQANTAVYLACL